MRIIALITAVVYICFLSKPLVSTVDFFVNQEEIAEELCENKAEPVLECNGKCYLMKTLEAETNPFDSELAENSEKDNKKENKKTNNKNSKLYELIPNALVLDAKYSAQTPKNWKPYRFTISTSYTSLQIPPPQA